MTPRPSSPTSLLWAHQIKREHGHLLNRLQKMEAAHDQQESRLKHAETAARSHANEDIAALAEQVKALDESGITERLARVEKDVMSKLDDVQAESEAIILKVASLEKDDVVAEEERRKSFNREKALLKRVAETEENLKKYEQSLVRLGRRVDDQSMVTIRSQLDGLMQQVEKEGSTMKLVVESTAALETANEGLKKANAKMAIEIEKLAAKAESAVAASEKAASVVTKAGGVKRSAPEPDSDDEDETPQPPQKKKKQSHKWAGGGADKDIIRQGSDVKPSGRTIASPYTAISKPALKAAPKPTTKPVSKPAPKPAPRPALKSALKPAPKPVQSQAPPKERKKPVASQAKAKTTVSHKAKAPASQKPAPKKGLATASSAKSQRYLDGQTDKPIVRAGKGWVEIAMTPSQSDAEDESEEEKIIFEETKRPKGRPRRSQDTDDIIGAASSTQRPARGGRQQLSPKPGPAKQRQKRKIEDEPSPAVTGGQYRPSTAMQAMKAAQKDRTRVSTGGVFTSPPSVRRSIERKDTKDALLAAVFTSQSSAQPGEKDEVAVTAPPAVPKRRRIIDLED
ncbi:hypothetical protein LTR10_007896 [Elasticomyces elasticus]|nr:hypothetical protein LTR10_007896 [Elasticomyces elasticus]KAK4970896.1 hypothetical protein LTR42_007873 [Elasticomyces elasticus]